MKKLVLILFAICSLNSFGQNLRGYKVEALDTLRTFGIMQFDTSYATSGTEPIGSSYWDADNGVISTVLGNDVVLQNGKEFFIDGQNDTGSPLTNGMPVMYAGSIGNSGNFRIKPALMTSDVPAYMFIGAVTETIADGEVGKVTTIGKIRGIQTNGANYGETWTDSTIIYPSATTAGYWTKFPPQAPNPAIPAALVISAHATNGTIEMRPTYPQRITEAIDVNGTALTETGQIMVWDNSNSYFDFNINIIDSLNNIRDTTATLRTDINNISTGTSPWTETVDSVYVTGKIVGIGTSSPQALLHAENTDAGSGAVISVVNNGGIAGSTFRMQDIATSNEWDFKATAANTFKIRDQQYGLDVMTIENNSAANSIYIDADGEVGIGTATPAYTLDVNGNSIVRGKFGVNIAPSFQFQLEADTIEYAALIHNDYTTGKGLHIMAGSPSSENHILKLETESGIDVANFYSNGEIYMPYLPSSVSESYVVGYNTSTDRLSYFPTPTGGGAPTNVNYLVGTADATLTNEIVVGTTPNGDLGGTWNNISVDNDSHAHTGGTISALSVSDFTSPNISNWTNDAGYLTSAAPVNATYITQTANGTLTNEQALSSLSSGFVKVTTGTGVLSSTSSINLATEVSGNLPVTNLNSGTSASSSTFWRGDGTWATPSVTATPAGSSGDVQYNNSGSFGGFGDWSPTGGLGADGFLSIDGGIGIAGTYPTFILYDNNYATNEYWKMFNNSGVLSFSISDDNATYYTKLYLTNTAAYFSNTLNVSGDGDFTGSVSLTETVPTITFSDTDSGQDDWEIEVNGDNLTIDNLNSEGGAVIFGGANNGLWSLDGYGDASNVHTGTATYNLEVNASGHIIETTAGSDFRKKENFNMVHNALEKVMSLTVYGFDWKDSFPNTAEPQEFDIYVSDDVDTRQSAGLIAQEVEYVIPEAVEHYINGYLGVDYDVITPYLIDALKEVHRTNKKQTILIVILFIWILILTFKTKLKNIWIGIRIWWQWEAKYYIQSIWYNLWAK